MLDLLVCPVTKQTLKLANAAELARLNREIEDGLLQFVDAKRVSDSLDGILVREDGEIGYGIFDNIPNLLVSEGIVLTKN